MSADDQARQGNSAAAGQVFDWDVFISYGRGDSDDFAKRIVDALRAQGLEVWFDRDTLKPGDDLVTEIPNALAKSRAAVFIISPAALTSPWVEQERNLAISRWIDGDWHGRIIPVLTGVDKPPSFLRTKLWVDFKDDSQFNDNIDRLVKGIRQGGVAGPRKPRSDEEQRLLSQLSFLWFFPEGMLDKLYGRLLAGRLSAAEATRAEALGLVRAYKTDGPMLKGAAPGVAAELGGYVTDRETAADELLSALEGWVAAESPFEIDRDADLGIGRAMLVRDMMSLARDLLPRESEEAEQKRERACEWARSLLSEMVEEGLLRIALEVSVALRAVSAIQRVADNLMHARVLLRAGDTSQAADIFDLYLGDDLFGDYGLSESERLACAIEWALALKRAGRAGARHAEIMKAYARMLDLAGRMREAAPESDEPLLRQAELRNNRATQVAVYGSDDEWPVAEEDFAEAADLYRLVGDDERLIATVANAVSHTLDRFDRAGKKPTAEELEQQLQSLEGLLAYADKSRPGEDLFFFLYQKARVLKRLHPDEPQLAREVYESAAWVANAAALTHREAVARRWVLMLRDKAGELAEADYVAGLRKCAAALERHQDDAWSYNALIENQLVLARILGRHQNKGEAWAVARQAFDLGARRGAWKKSESARSRLKRVLGLLDGFHAGGELYEEFVKQNEPLLRALLSIPAYKPVNWEQVAAQLK